MAALILAVETHNLFTKAYSSQAPSFILDLCLLPLCHALRQAAVS